MTRTVHVLILESDAAIGSGVGWVWSEIRPRDTLALADTCDEDVDVDDVVDGWSRSCSSCLLVTLSSPPQACLLIPLWTKYINEWS